jgi:hypothetical protein
MPPKKKTPDSKERREEEERKKDKLEKEREGHKDQGRAWTELVPRVHSINQSTPNGDRPPWKKKVSTTLTINPLKFNPFTINASSKPQRKGSVPAQSTINASTKPQRKGRVPAQSTIKWREFTKKERKIQDTHNAQQGRA